MNDIARTCPNCKHIKVAHDRSPCNACVENHSNFVSKNSGATLEMLQDEFNQLMVENQKLKDRVEHCELYCNVLKDSLNEETKYLDRKIDLSKRELFNKIRRKK